MIGDSGGGGTVSGMSDRADFVTGLVSSWLLTDPKRRDVAREYAQKGERQLLVGFAVDSMQAAEPGTPAWEVARELAPADRYRIDWDAVLDRLAQA